MGRNLEKDALQMAAKNRRILENGFRIFAEKTLEKIKMTEVAEAAGVSIASLYRYYSTKTDLVLGINAWAWETYTKDNVQKLFSMEADRSAAEELEAYLESFLELYRSHRDLLRFNQFFNAYVQSEGLTEVDLSGYTKMIRQLAARFGETYRKGQQDGTLITDLPEEKMFSVTLHLMLAAVTRYAVGLAYNEGTDAEEELRLQKDVLLARFDNRKEKKQKK